MSDPLGLKWVWMAMFPGPPKTPTLAIRIAGPLGRYATPIAVFVTAAINQKPKRKTPMTSYIEDGYTRDDGYIAAPPAGKSGETLWAPLEFTYRVATRSEVIRHDARVRIALQDEDRDPESAVQAEKLASEFVAEKVKSWNLKNSKGLSVPVSADTCSRINPGLFGILYRIVRGSQVSDAKPPATEKPKSDADMVGNFERVSG